VPQHGRVCIVRRLHERLRCRHVSPLPLCRALLHALSAPRPAVHSLTLASQQQPAALHAALDAATPRHSRRPNRCCAFLAHLPLHALGRLPSHAPRHRRVGSRRRLSPGPPLLASLLSRL
jgi:hypothetical protein